MLNLKVVPWFGESRNLFCVVDLSLPEMEQPAILCAFNLRQEVEAFIYG